MLALNGGRPEQLNLKDIVSAFVSFREEVVTKRTTFLLKKARERAHILAGLLVALNNIENILEIYKYHIIRYENAESSEKLVALLGEKSKNMKPSSARN